MKPCRIIAILQTLLLLPVLALAGPVDAPPGITITGQRQYQYAETLFQRGDNAVALSEFKRFLFFFPEDSLAPRAALRVGQCHARLGSPDAAIQALKDAAETFPGTPSAMTALFLISEVYQRSGQPAQALINLQNMLLIYPATGIQDQIRYRMAWIHIETSQWENAAAILGKVGAVGREDLPIADLRAALGGSKDIPHKNPSLAGALSAIPGGGQLYCGRRQDALVAFLLNGGLIWAAVEAFDQDLYALGAIISVVEFGFYAGNIYGAIGSAHKYNAHQNTNFIENLKLKFHVTADPFHSLSEKLPAIGLALSLSF